MFTHELARLQPSVSARPHEFRVTASELLGRSASSAILLETERYCRHALRIVRHRKEKLSTPASDRSEVSSLRKPQRKPSNTAAWNTIWVLIVWSETISFIVGTATLRPFNSASIACACK